MALFRCKMCGGTLEIVENSSVATCEYCGTQQTLPRLDNDRKTNMYDRANHFRRNNEYDKAMGIYEQILAEDATDAEAYWSLVLCRYGIEYVEDPLSHKRIPTVNRAQFTAVYDDDNYKSALQYADSHQRRLYEEEARTINEIQKGILDISQREEPFDVFICYKESDKMGRRTPDSVLAQELYYQLERDGFKTFFSRITLEDKLGTAYEPYIFAALNSAKVMVVIGTKPEHFQAVWVKNEWSRYLSLMKQGQKKILIPAYKDMDPYDMPEEFSHLQAQDMSKLGFMQDLTRGIRKLIQADKPAAEVNIVSGSVSPAALVKRAAIFLEDGNLESANEYCEKTLDLDPECADAYVIKLLMDLGIPSREQLPACAEPFDDNPNYIRAVRFGSETLKAELSGALDHIRSRNEQARIEGIYRNAAARMETPQTEDTLLQLSRDLESIEGYRDARALAARCRAMAEDARKDAILAAGLSCMERTPETADNFEEAIREFQKISGWKDADTQISLCRIRAAELAKKAEADRLEQERQAEIDRREAEKRAARNRKIALIAAASAAVCIAAAVVWIFVLSPMIRYSQAQTHLDSGSYDEAITLFAELEDYKDSPEKVLEAKYAKAEKLLAGNEFDTAAALFEELGDYSDSVQRVSAVHYAKADFLLQSGDYSQAAEIFLALDTYADSAQRYPAVILDYAAALIGQGDRAAAREQLALLAEYSDYADQADALYVSMVDAYYAEGSFVDALAVYECTTGYDETSEQYKDLMYRCGASLLEQKQFIDAREKFKDIPGYLDADTMVKECDYLLGKDQLWRSDFHGAISSFERAGDYKDSQTQIQEVKYQYIRVYKSRYDDTVYEYLKELKAAGYKDCADIYNELYAWKVNIVVNDDEEDETTDMSSISKYSNWYFHLSVEGGEPDGELMLEYVGYFPNGDTYSGGWDTPWADGWVGCCWFYYNDPPYGQQGTFRLKVFDNNGNLLGEKTVKITG